MQKNWSWREKLRAGSELMRQNPGVLLRNFRVWLASGGSLPTRWAFPQENRIGWQMPFAWRATDRVARSISHIDHVLYTSHLLFPPKILLINNIYFSIINH